MEYRKMWGAVGTLTALAVLTACSGTVVAPNSQGLQTQISTDIAASTGQAAVSDVNETGNDATGDGTYALVMPHGSSASLSFGMGGNACTETGAPEDLRYYCKPDSLFLTKTSPLVNDTLVRQWNYEFFAQGTAQAHADSMTDSINFGGANGVLVYVAVHRTRWHGVSHRVRNHSVTDHPSFARDTMQQSTWNGNTLATDTAAYTGPVWSVNYTGVAYDTTASVVFQRPRGQNPFPLSGQFRRWATWEYTADGPSTKTGTISRHIVVTFNGTETAQLQVIGTTTLTCSVDLVTGDVFDCH
jgi:hypothetical protein